MPETPVLAIARIDLFRPTGLICSAEVPAQELYIEDEGAFEFERTVSRLIDIQSECYLQSRHVGD
ncbi:MAG: hypothetical protein NTY50_11505 [Methylobacter sp.]|nr:hypothetical protein [Methylobacter sp.]